VVDLLIFVGALLYGTFLIWGGSTAIRFMAPMVIAPRPPMYVHMRLAAIWSVGLATILAGIVLVAAAIQRGV
jgi:hypothetical protein